MAQKVKSVEDRCDLKKWVGQWWWWISSRSGWLLELLTELTKKKTEKIGSSELSDDDEYDNHKNY